MADDGRTWQCDMQAHILLPLKKQHVKNKHFHRMHRIFSETQGHVIFWDSASLSLQIVLQLYFFHLFYLYFFATCLF